MIKNYFRRHPIRTRRALEILPGFVSWSLILFPFWGSFVVPNFVAYYVIGFAVYWLYRSLSLALLSVLAHFQLKAAIQLDWLKDLQQRFPGRWQQIQHIIVIPTYKEPMVTLERTLTALSHQTFPTKNLHIMLSFEVREGIEAQEKAQALQKKYGPLFGHVWTTFHPDIDGEVKGKSSNTAWGARQAKLKLADTAQIPIENITITSEDADALFHQQYFACLTFQFLNSAKPFNKIWQGAIAFYNNIWEVPTPVRVLAAIFSVTQMHILMRRDRLVNFSTYSTSLKLLKSVGYWDTDVIPEDYRIFFKTYFATKGKVSVDPIFLPALMDAAQSSTFGK